MLVSQKASARYAGGTYSSAGNVHHEVQHALVEDLPGANLLLNHVESCLLEVHLLAVARTDCRLYLYVFQVASVPF